MPCQFVHGLVGIDDFSVNRQQGAFAGSLYQRAVAVFCLPQPALGARALLFNAAALEQQVAENCQQNQGNHPVGDPQVNRERGNFVFHIVDVNAGPDNPVPLGNTAHVGKLRRAAGGIVLPLPLIFQIAFAVFLHQFDKLDEQFFSAFVFGVGVVGQILSGQIGAVGMHDHDRLHIGDPEIVLSVLAVAQLGKFSGGLGLRRRAGH